MGLCNVSPNPSIGICHTLGVGHAGTRVLLWAPFCCVWGMRWARLGSTWHLSLFLEVS